MKKFYLIAVLILCALFNLPSAFAGDHMSVNITSVSFSNDGGTLWIYSNLVNDGDTDLTVTKVVLPVFNLWDDGRDGFNMQANNITADNLNIFVKAGHYVEFPFKLAITSAMRTYFIGAPHWNYKYNILYRRNIENDNDNDDEDYDEDDEENEDDSF